MLEKQIEEYLISKTKSLKCRIYKFVSPGIRGVPDRMILIPGGRSVFVELKAPGKKLNALQKQQLGRISALGFSTYVIDSKEGVDEIVSLIDSCLNPPSERKAYVI